MKKSKGITLIALVITIVVLLILAGVMFATLNGENNVQSMAQNAVDQYRSGSGTEEVMLKNVSNQLDDVYNRNTPIDLESKVGCYADFDDDGIVDGIIYADRAVGCSGSWGNDANSEYKLTAQTIGLKEYCVVGTYTGKQVVDGEVKKVTKNVIAPMSGTIGEERFYIIALKNYTHDNGITTSYYWNEDNTSEVFTIESSTEIELGTGKTNTAILIANSTLNSNINNIWSHISSEVAKGWYVMSRAEWSACGVALKITKTNYEKLGFDSYFLSSSQRNTAYAWWAGCCAGRIAYWTVTHNHGVRLGYTF